MTDIATIDGLIEKHKNDQELFELLMAIRHKLKQRI